MPSSKLTPEVTDQIARLIRVGNTVEVAAVAAGISRSTYFAWMDRGTKAGKADEPYREFREAVGQARAEAEAVLVGARVEGRSQRFLVRRRLAARTPRPGAVGQTG